MSLSAIVTAVFMNGPLPPQPGTPQPAPLFRIAAVLPVLPRIGRGKGAKPAKFRIKKGKPGAHQVMARRHGFTRRIFPSL